LLGALLLTTLLEELHQAHADLTTDDIEDLFPCSIDFTVSPENPLYSPLADIQSYTPPSPLTLLSQLFDSGIPSSFAKNTPTTLSPTPTIQLSLSTLMEPTAQCMPPCNYLSAPKWDKLKPRELTQYFKELEYLFRDCSITNHTQMKEYAARYVTYNTAETWTGLLKFAATTIPVGDQAATAISYKNWKEAVICLYPGTEESTCYTVNKLHQLVQDNFDLSAYMLGTFSTYYRKFQKISWWLLQHSKIHTNKERRLFQQGIPTLLWAKIARRLEILKPTHHPKDPYNVKDVYEAGDWHLMGSDTSLGILHTKGILPVQTQPQATNNTVITNNYIKKEDMEAAISAAVVSAMTRIETMINTQLRQMRCGIDGKVVLSIGTNIPNYLELKSYQKRVNEWHRCNSGNVATGTLSGNANSDADQHVQQQLIHKVLHLDSVGDKGGLSKESRIAALEMELNALKNQVFDGVEVPRPKQPLKSYKPMTATNDPALPAPEAPSVPTSTVPADNMPTIANVPIPCRHFTSILNSITTINPQHNETLVPLTSALMALTDLLHQSMTLKNPTKYSHAL
ncbi:hypothetical protein C0993_010434, partial [Termitomyces sp. T159_Od127]